MCWSNLYRSCKTSLLPPDKLVQLLSFAMKTDKTGELLRKVCAPPPPPPPPPTHTHTHTHTHAHTHTHIYFGPRYSTFSSQFLGVGVKKLCDVVRVGASEPCVTDCLELLAKCSRSRTVFNEIISAVF